MAEPARNSGMDASAAREAAIDTRKAGQTREHVQRLTAAEQMKATEAALKESGDRRLAAENDPRAKAEAFARQQRADSASERAHQVADQIAGERRGSFPVIGNPDSSRRSAPEKKPAVEAPKPRADREPFIDTKTAAGYHPVLSPEIKAAMQAGIEMGSAKKPETMVAVESVDDAIAKRQTAEAPKKAQPEAKKSWTDRLPAWMKPKSRE